MVKRTLVFLDRFYWLWLLLATPFLLFPTPKRSLALLVIPALFLLRWLAVKMKPALAASEIHTGGKYQTSMIPFTPLNGALVLMMVMVLVSLWVTFDINFSLPKICGVVLGWGIFFAFTRAGQTSRGWWLGFFLLLGIGVGIATIGLLGTNWLTKINFLSPIISRLPPRIKGLPGAMEGFQPNTVAGTLLWVIPGQFIFSWFLLARRKNLRSHLGLGRTIGAIGLAIGVTFYTMVVLILTQSREGYISLAITLPVLVLIALPLEKLRYGLMVLILLVILTGVLLAFHREAVQNWVLGNDQTPNPAFSLDSFKSRLEIWSRAILGIHDFPFTGMGMDAFRKVAPVIYPFFTIPPEKDIGHAHNEFLQAALDLGIPGLIAFMAIYIIGFWMLIKIWQEARTRIYSGSKANTVTLLSAQVGERLSKIEAALLVDGWGIRMLVLGLAGGLLAHLLWGLTDAIALGARSSFPFWILLGLVCGIYQQVRDNWMDTDGAISDTDTKNRGQP